MGQESDWRGDVCLFGAGWERLRRELARCMSCAGLELHIKQTRGEAHKQTAQRMKSSNEEVQGQKHYYGSTLGFFLHLKSDTSWPLITFILPPISRAHTNSPPAAWGGPGQPAHPGHPE